MRHIGCSSEAASGNVVEFHIGEFHKVTNSIEIVSHTFEGGGGGGGGPEILLCEIAQSCSMMGG